MFITLENNVSLLKVLYKNILSCFTNCTHKNSCTVDINVIQIH